MARIEMSTEDVVAGLVAIPDQSRRSRIVSELATRLALRVTPTIHCLRGDDKYPFWMLSQFRCLSTAWTVLLFQIQINSLQASLQEATENAELVVSQANSYLPVMVDHADAQTISEGQYAVDALIVGQLALSALDGSTSSHQNLLAAQSRMLSVSLVDDYELLDRVSGKSILNSALWPKSIPPAISEQWSGFKSVAAGDWDVWINWYEAVSLGQIPWPEAAAVEIVTLPDDIWKLGPAVVNKRIKEILARHQQLMEAMQIPPEPTAAPGPVVEFQNGRLALVDGVPTKSGFDAATQGILHERLKTRLPLLSELSNRTSNTFPGLKLAVDEYATFAARPLDELDTENFWMSGLALLTQAQAFERQDPDSGYGRLDAPHQAILSEVAGLHGGLILGFPKGRTLTERAREAQLPAALILEPPTVALLDAFKENSRLLDVRLRRFVHTSRETIRIAGWDAARAGYGAYAVVRNMLIKMGTAIVGVDRDAARRTSNSFIGQIAIGVVVSTAPNTLGISFDSVVALIEFFRTNYTSIFQYAASFPELRVWIAYVMDFLDKDRGE